MPFTKTIQGVYVAAMFKREFDMDISRSFVSRWFHHIGPYKGTMRKTSIFPHKKGSPEVMEYLDRYINFMINVRDHSRIVFSDEKPMKEIDIFGCVRRDPVTGEVPANLCSTVNSRNSYSILAAITLKKDVNPVSYGIIDVSTNAVYFQSFVRKLIETGVLVKGDIFVVDNCTIHCQGDNDELQEWLWNDFGIFMITLPPYHPELNPTELVFNGLTQRLRSADSRFQCINNENFIEWIEEILDGFTRSDMKKFYRKDGYYLRSRNKGMR